MDLTVYNTGMLIKFSKQIANSFVKIIKGWRFLEVILEAIHNHFKHIDNAFSAKS